MLSLLLFNTYYPLVPRSLHWIQSPPHPLVLFGARGLFSSSAVYTVHTTTQWPTLDTIWTSFSPFNNIYKHNRPLAPCTLPRLVGCRRHNNDYGRWITAGWFPTTSLAGRHLNAKPCNLWIFVCWKERANATKTPLHCRCMNRVVFNINPGCSIDSQIKFHPRLFS